MDPVKLAETWAGRKCPQCKSEDCVLWLITATSLVGCECGRVIDVNPKFPELSYAKHTLTCVDTAEGPRYFISPKDIAPEDLLGEIFEAYVRLENTSLGWTGSDMIQTIFVMLQHGLEKIGVKELFEGEFCNPMPEAEKRD